jgi:glycosyltransferase involved in cell wall biosynthesis
LVATFYGSDINIGWQRRISRMTLGRARRRIFVSRRLADLWPSERNVLLPNGIDFETCRPRERGEACRALGLDPGLQYVLFGGAPGNAVKGHDVFQEALSFLQTSHPRVRPLVLSEPGQSHERVITKLNAASVLLFTSRRGSEGSPTVVKEALAVGLPVVSVDVGDVGEMLDGITPGGVVPWPASGGFAGKAALARSLAAKVAIVLDSGARSNGREQRSFLRQEEIARRLVDIYREVLREAGHDLRYR